MASLKTGVPSYSLACLRYIGGSKFLVAHERNGQTNGKYTCVEFLLRDTAILQIKEAELSDNLNTSLCHDSNLKLNGWIIIDFNALKSRKEVCSLTGGYNMQVYDKSSNTGVCDGYLGETRLESECLPDEGLHFYFRQASCVPDGLLMYPTQRTQCLISWTVGKFNFILISEESFTYLWLLRYPKIVVYGVTLHALLMKDLYATKESTIRVSHNYLSLTLSSQSPKTLASLCYDDYEICSTLSDPCSYSEDIARTCAKTCGFCTEDSPRTCQFKLPITDTWIDTRQSDKRPNINVTASEINVENVETLHCIEWANGPKNSGRNAKEIMSSNDGNQFQEQMLVSVTQNGCRPRYTCARFTKMNQVLFMHLSQTKLWPLVKSKDDPYDCSGFKYESSLKLDDNPYRTNTTNLQITTQITHSSTCDLSEFEYFTAYFENSRKCFGQMHQNNVDDIFQPILKDCSVYTFSSEYRCIEHSTFVPTKDKLLITVSISPPYHVHCWLFPFDHQDTTYVVESENCNYKMYDRIVDGTLIPIAKLLKGHVSISTTPKAGNSSIIIDALTSVLTSVGDETTTPTIGTTTPKGTSNSTDTGVDDGSTKPAMAAATVVMSLVLVMGALMCKCKC